MIYFDHAATTPISSDALQVFIKASKEYFANPSSLHEQGEKAKLLLEKCRAEVAGLLRVEAAEMYFTSGGSEANTLALESLFFANRHKGNHIITSQTEHPSVHSVFHKLEQQGIEVTYLAVNPAGQISLQDLQHSIRPDTVLASIQHVNSETGTIQDIKAIGEILAANDVLFHSDCVQSFTKLPIHASEWPIDAISISSHKVCGPKGVGAVYLSSKVQWFPVQPFTSHERGFRQGTVNVPGIAAFTAAAANSMQLQEQFLKKMSVLRDNFFRELHPISHLITIEGTTGSQIPHIIGMGIKGVEGQYMMLTLDRHGICISTGSACQAGKQEPSVTMKALNKSPEEAKRFFRISFGMGNTEEEIRQAANIIIKCVSEFH
ncbi:cysteine desulfurase [Evansella caseinilytica]|uniref:Cysteine desulfurase n=1 Tax=Evansella caseinilytica TaxID=1503961 RepID=A0A1H3QRH0_9BACI|nr:IscS subfamily cysteine desulfurase [Evansella caseinilytica]SDZ15997.1 cysteine desulfurase [Evansella caseinilytica]